MSDIAPKSRGDQRAKKRQYKPKQFVSQRGRGRGKRLPSNAHRYEDSDIGVEAEDGTVKVIDIDGKERVVPIEDKPRSSRLPPKPSDAELALRQSLASEPVDLEHLQLVDGEDLEEFEEDDEFDDAYSSEEDITDGPEPAPVTVPQHPKPKMNFAAGQPDGAEDDIDSFMAHTDLGTNTEPKSKGKADPNFQNWLNSVTS